MAGFSLPWKTRFATADSMLSRSFGLAAERLEKVQLRQWRARSERETLSTSFRSGNSIRSGAAAALSRGPSSGSASISRSTASRISLSSFFVSSSLEPDPRLEVKPFADFAFDPTRDTNRREAYPRSPFPHLAVRCPAHAAPPPAQHRLRR